MFSIPPIPLDKRLHLAGGALAFVAGYVYSGGDIGVAMSWAVAAGIGKEVYDWVVNKLLALRGKPPAHDVDVKDALFTIAGGCFAAVCITMVNVAWSHADPAGHVRAVSAAQNFRADVSQHLRSLIS